MIPFDRKDEEVFIMAGNNKYSKEFKIKALREYKKSGITPTEFAEKYNIPDSTFFDWVKKYDANECWLEVTNKIEAITDRETFHIEGPKPLVIVGDMIKDQPQEEIMTMTYRGITISFHHTILRKVMEVIKDAEL